MKTFLLLEQRTWSFFLGVFFLCYGLEIRLWVFSLLLGHMIVSS